MRPVHIPKTSPERYISFLHALNLRYPDEDTGDWHFMPSFFIKDGEADRSVVIAGKGCKVDTTPSLKDLGVREMSDILIDQGVIKVKTPVYVANHYRAIADLVMADLLSGRRPTVAGVSDINDWLDTEEQVTTLKNEYLNLLGSQLSGQNKIIYNEWIETVGFQ
ncbi:MAG: hypothetical protein HRU28_12385 [Rhizobiales bacterium]|nr:hypothetical protein [Hyphomicrobiales bacterium]